MKCKLICTSLQWNTSNRRFYVIIIPGIRAPTSKLGQTNLQIFLSISGTRVTQDAYEESERALTTEAKGSIKLEMGLQVQFSGFHCIDLYR